MVLLKITRDGQTLAQCDSRCYNAERDVRVRHRCLCGGKNYGVGEAAAVERIKADGLEMLREWYEYEVSLSDESVQAGFGFFPVIIPATDRVVVCDLVHQMDLFAGNPRGWWDNLEWMGNREVFFHSIDATEQRLVEIRHSEGSL